jgi:hypothetical protein
VGRCESAQVALTLRNSFLDAIARILLRERREQYLELLFDFLATKPYFPGSIDELAVVDEKVDEVRRRFAFQSGKKTAHCIHRAAGGLRRYAVRIVSTGGRRWLTIAASIARQLQPNFCQMRTMSPQGHCG